MPIVAARARSSTISVWIRRCSYKCSAENLICLSTNSGIKRRLKNLRSCGRARYLAVTYSSQSARRQALPEQDRMFCKIKSTYSRSNTCTVAATTFSKTCTLRIRIITIILHTVNQGSRPTTPGPSSVDPQPWPVPRCQRPIEVAWIQRAPCILAV